MIDVSFQRFSTYVCVFLPLVGLLAGTYLPALRIAPVVSIIMCSGLMILAMFGSRSFSVVGFHFVLVHYFNCVPYDGGFLGEKNLRNIFFAYAGLFTFSRLHSAAVHNALYIIERQKLQCS